MQVRAGMLRAVEDEVREVRRRLGALEKAELRLREGVLLEATPGAFVYRFTCERLEAEPGDETAAALQLPEDTTGVLEAEGRFIPAAVLRHDPVAREVTLELQVVAALPRAEGKLTFSTVFLLAALQARLLELAADPLPPAEAALEGRGLPLPVERTPSLDGLGPDQADAVRGAVAGGVSFLWGPPGTGKTRTLAHLAAGLLAAGETVLLTANTNVAVDRLVAATLDVLGSPGRPPLLRVGRIGAALRGRGVSAEEHLGNDPAFRSGAERLCALLLAAGVSIPAERDVEAMLRLAGWAAGSLEVLAGQLGQAAAEVLDAATGVLAVVANLDAPIMAATLSGTCVRHELRARRFDTVVVDEAGMASVAWFAAAGGLARRRVVIAGDFQQLPPIALADTPEARLYLGQHMFAFVGCDDVRRDHPLRSLLREQWRMHPEIRRAVSRVFYGDRLVDAPAVAGRDGGGGVLLVDTHACRPTTHRTPSRSISNAVHARLVAGWLADTGWSSVGVIAPYRAQARLIRAALRRTCRARLESGAIQVSTVHRFQGEERDLIVFDTTDAPGRGAARFLDDARNPAAANLVNVAVSRAKHALLIVGDVPHLRAHLGASSSVVEVIREVMRPGQEEVDASEPEDLERLRAFLRAD